MAALSLASVLVLSVGARVGAQAAPDPHQALAYAAARSESANGAATQRAEPPPRCHAGVRLVGSVMNARHPQRSKAALHNKNGTRVMAPGQRIDDLTLLAVKPTRAILQTAQGAACYLPVYLPAQERPPATAQDRAARPQPAKAKPERSKREVSDAIKRGVRELGPGRYAITRETLLSVLANPAALAKSAGVRPLIKDGRSLGMQLVRLRSDSPLRLLGLEKGDVLRHVSGHALSTPDGMLEAIRMLRESASNKGVMLGVLRKDAPLNISIAIE